MNDRDHVKRDAILAFSIRIASAAALYLSQVLMARWMGAFEYGIYVSVWTTVLLLGGVSHLGFALSTMRLVPELTERSDHERLRGLLVASRAITVLASSALAVSGLAFLWVVGDRLAPHYLAPLAIALFCLPMYVLSDVQDGIARGQAWMLAGLLPPYVLRPLMVLLAMLAARQLDLPMTATIAAGAAVIATWSSTLLQLAWVEWRLRERIPAGSRRYELRAWTAASLPLLAMGIAEIVLQSADVLLLALFVPPAQVAIYFAAAKTMSLAMFVNYAVGSAVSKRLATMSARGDHAQLARFVRDASHWTFWPSLAATLALLTLGWPLLWLFGPSFVEAYPAMAVLALGYLVRAAFGPVEFVLNMLGEQRACAGLVSAAAAIAVALNLVLIPQLGIMGAAIATAVALVSGALMKNWAARRRLGLETSVLGWWTAR